MVMDPLSCQEINTLVKISQWSGIMLHVFRALFLKFGVGPGHPGQLLLPIEIERKDHFALISVPV